MNSQRILGIVLLVFAVLVLNATHTLALGNTVTGKFTVATTWFVLGDIAAAVFAVLVVILGVRRRSA